MNQPGVYFTLDAPHVSIIGLYSNVLEGPGVISSQGGNYPTMNDDQLTFLTEELTRLAPAREAGQLAIVLATHHPPASADAKHGGGTGLATDIDSCCQKAGIWPDAVLSGHAHLYERFTRLTSDGRQIPYIVAGAGGYAATAPRAGLKPPQTWGDYTLVAEPIAAFGYLTVTVDLTAQTLQLSYHPSDTSIAGDQVTVNLTDHTRELTVPTDDATLLNAYRPVMQYDSHEPYFADHAARDRQSAGQLPARPARACCWRPPTRARDCCRCSDPTPTRGSSPSRRAAIA